MSNPFRDPSQLSHIFPILSGQAQDDDAIRVILLTGSGRAFCAGADLGLSDPEPCGFARALGDYDGSELSVPPDQAGAVSLQAHPDTPFGIAYPALPYLALRYPTRTLPYPTLPYPTLPEPYPTLPLRHPAIPHPSPLSPTLTIP